MSSKESLMKSVEIFDITPWDRLKTKACTLALQDFKKKEIFRDCKSPCAKLEWKGCLIGKKLSNSKLQYNRK